MVGRLARNQSGRWGNLSISGMETPCNVWYCVLGSGGKGWRFDQNLRGPASWRLPALPGSCSSSSSRRSCGIGNGSDSGMRPCGHRAGADRLARQGPCHRADWWTAEAPFRAAWLRQGQERRVPRLLRLFPGIRNRCPLRDLRQERAERPVSRRGSRHGQGVESVRGRTPP